MKKITVSIMTSFIFFSIKAVSQENKPLHVIKKQQFCSAEITLMDKSVEKFALGGFSNDSIIVFPIQLINKHTKIQVERGTRIAATNIKKIAIRIEKVRNSPGIYFNDSTYKKGVNDSIASALKKIKSDEVVDNTLGSLSFFSDPLSAVIGIALLPVLIPAFILISQEKVYHINGKQERLDLMMKKLTVKKSKTKKALNTKNQI